MKQATYFEDLQKDVFIIRVEENGQVWLEQRRWHKNDYEHTPDDDFDRFKESGASPEEKYEWITSRSDLMGVSKDTGKWMDREWCPAPKL